MCNKEEEDEEDEKSRTVFEDDDDEEDVIVAHLETDAVLLCIIIAFRFYVCLFPTRVKNESDAVTKLFCVCVP